MQDLPCFVFEPFSLDVPNARLWRVQAVVPLPPKPFALLCCLVAQAGRLVTKDALLQAVWPETVVQEEVLTVAIGQMRQVLGDRARPPQFIEAVYGRGYRFIAPVAGAVSALDRPQREAARPLPLTAACLSPRIFVGRETALARVQQWWVTVRQGQRQLGFLAGEAGIGKTALVDTFVAQVAAAEDVWIGHGQCMDHYGAGEAYLPVLEALGRLCRGADGVAFRAVLQQHAPSWLVHLPAVLAPGDRERLVGTASGVTPAQMLRELADALEVLTTIRPLVLVLEDLHWSDRATLEWLAYVARRRDPARLLLLGTYRPVEVIVQAHPLRPLLAEIRQHPQCAELVLDALSVPAVATYLTQRFAAHPLPASLPQRWHQRTSGNPLFLIALVDELVRQGRFEPGGDVWEGQVPLSGLMPTSLRQYLEQHVEQLSAEDQAFLEVASVAGSTFAVAAVAAGVAQADATLEARYTALARQGRFVRAVGTETWPDGTVTACYQFLHAVYHEVVYARVSAGHRVRLHQQIGLRKEAGYGAEAPTIAAELAMHFMRAQDARRAVAYLYQAADTALRRQAYQEVLQHSTTGLTLLATLPESPERARQELRVHLTCGPALIVTNGSVASEVEHTYTRAWELAQHVGDTPQRFAVLWGLWMFYETRGALPKARQLGEELLAVAQQAQDPGLLLEAHRVLGDTCYFLGEFALARTHLAQAIALYAPHQSRAHAFLSGGDPGIYCRAFVALPLLMLGYPAQARASIRAALTLAQELAHPYSETIARYYAARLHQLCRDGHATQEQADAMIVLATVHGFPLWLAGGMILRGWALAEQGQGAAGIAQIHQGLAARRSTGEETPRPYYLALLAEAYGKVGQFDEGLHVLAEALTAVHTTGERFYEAELYRLQGAFLLAQEGTKPPATGKEHRGQAAAACFHYALTIARGQQAKWWELQAARCISRLSQQQGQPVEAQRLITDMDDWFPEG